MKPGPPPLPDIPDIPDPSATEAPKQFGSAVREILEPDVFEPMPKEMVEDEPTDMDSLSDVTAPMDEGPTLPPSKPKKRPQAMQTVQAVQVVHPTREDTLPPDRTREVAQPSPVPAETDAPTLLQVAVFFGVVAAVVFVILAVAFGGATLFGLVIGVVMR